MGNVAQDKDEYVPMEQNDGLYYRNFPNISRVLIQSAEPVQCANFSKPRDRGSTLWGFRTKKTKGIREN